MKLKNLFALGFVICGFSSVAKADEVNQTQSLLNYFGSSCPSQGEWTNRAISQAQSLIQVMNAIKEDPDCKTLAGTVSQLNLMADRIAYVAANPIDVELYKMKRKQEDLLLQLTIAKTDAERELLLTSLKQLQTEIADQETANDASRINRKRDDFGKALNTLIMSTNLVMNQAISNQACLMKKPALLSGVAAVAGSVWATLASSSTSLVIAASVELMGNILESLRKSKIAKQMSQMNESILHSAFSCVTESLSNQWCAAEDTLSIIEMKMKPITNNDPIIQGMRILDREMPNALQWFESVRAGAEPGSMAEASEIAGANAQEASLKNARVYSVGIINDARKRFQTASTDDVRWSIVKEAVENLLNFLSSGVFTAVIDSQYAPYYLLGFSRDQMPKDDVGNFVYFNYYVPGTHGWPSTIPFPPMLESLKAPLDSWIRQGERQAAEDRSLVTQPDPLVIFYDAITPRTVGPIKGLTPQTSIKRLSEFLQKNQPKELDDEVQKRLYMEMIASLESVLAKITEASTAVSSSEDPEALKAELIAILNNIYIAIRLDRSGLFEARVNRAVRISLQEILFSGNSGLDPAEAARFLAAEDIIKELLQISPRTNLAMIRSDLLNSQRITQNTLQVFYDIFQSNLDRVLKSYKKGADLERKTHTTKRIYRDGLAQMCLSMLAIPDWRSDPFHGPARDLCYGEGLISLWVGAPASDPIEAKIFNREIKDRACLLRNYYRSQKIYQDRSETLANQDLSGKLDRGRPFR